MEGPEHRKEVRPSRLRGTQFLRRRFTARVATPGSGGAREPRPVATLSPIGNSGPLEPDVTGRESRYLDAALCTRREDCGQNAGQKHTDQLDLDSDDLHHTLTCQAKTRSHRTFFH